MLKLQNEFKELEEVGIIKNLQIDYINEQFVFEFAIPEADVMETLENYLFETYGLVLNCSRPQM